MVHSETKITKLKTEAFQIAKRLGTSIYIDLFSKTIISVVSDKHHYHPVISGVTRNLFRATDTYNIIHRIFSSRTFYRAHRSGVPRATKNRYILNGEKRDATFHLRVLRYASNPAVLSIATIKI